MALVGAPLTMASIAVLPVLLGLAVDYAIQYQARIADPPTPDGGASARRAPACRRSRPRRSPPRRASSCCCSRPVPMVRGLRRAARASASASRSRCALTGGTAALVHARAARAARRAARRARRAGRASCSAAAARPLARLGARRPGGSATACCARRSRARAACSRSALAVAALGWVVDTQTEVRSDLQALVPQDLPAVRDLDTLQRTTGVAGRGRRRRRGPRPDRSGGRRLDARVPAARAAARRATAPENGCGKAALCPALSLPDLFQGERAASDRAKIDALLDAVPPYFSQAVITGDRRTANLAFGIRLMPLDEQHAVIERMRAALDPPDGRDARGSPGCRCWPPRRTPRSRRRGGGSGRCSPACSRSALVLLARLPARRARVGAARADRAGHGLVGARAVRAADPAQPDVGDARRARDRDLDRVRRAARRALPRGARGRARAGRGAAAHVRVDRRGGARVGRDGDRRASRCSRSPTCGCCRSSAS